MAAVRLLVTFTIVFSLFGLSSTLATPPGIVALPRLAHAVLASNEPWYPAGPAMDTLTIPIFVDESAEYSNLQSSNPAIDFTDSSLDSSIPGATTICASSSFVCTNPILDAGYYELEFMMGNNFWGCNFNFGNAACGTHIRQAFAHAMDKNIFLSTELAGNGQAIDNPVPPIVELNTPNPCGWDSSHPQTGANCIVNGPGGTAYHLATATAGVGSAPPFAFTPGEGTPDFCAAADHLIAAGLATGKNPTTCVLSNISTSVGANPIQIYTRSDDTPRLHAGNSYGQFICALFTGAFTTSCSGILTTVPGGPAGFPGFTTCPPIGPCGTTVNNSWWIYTAYFGNVLTFDGSLYRNYDSRFVSGISSIKQPTGPCSPQATPTFSPTNYMYICNSNFDSKIDQATFAPCLTAPGDPATGQTTPTFANCPSAIQLSSASAAYQAQDIFGQNAYTIPWYSQTNEQFAYLNNGWQHGTVNTADGFAPPGNFFLSLNAYNPSPPTAGTIRQGYSLSTASVNPFSGYSNIPGDQGIIRSVYDTLGVTNPSSPQGYMDWMTVKTDQLAVSALSYIAPTGTVAAFRYTLRNDIYWHTGQQLTAWDVAFSYIAYKVNGVMPGLSVMTGIKVLGPTQFDIDVSAAGPFTELYLSNPVLPGRDWVNNNICTPSSWDSAVGNPNFAAANSALTTCIAPSSAVTSSGVITPTASNIDSSKIQPTYDPVANSNLIGSGPWVCVNGSAIGQSCSPNRTQQVPSGGLWTFQRYGKGTTPGGSLNTYFRSSGTLALWIWGRTTGHFDIDFTNLSIVALCYGKPLGTAGCTHWQYGIGGSPGGTVIGVTQVSIVQRFVGLNWVSPYNWISAPPQNIAAFPPVLHEGSATLNPCSMDPVGGYDC